jgi:hypothetical protein
MEVEPNGKVFPVHPPSILHGELWLLVHSGLNLPLNLNGTAGATSLEVKCSSQNMLWPSP